MFKTKTKHRPYITTLISDPFADLVDTLTVHCLYRTARAQVYAFVCITMYSVLCVYFFMAHLPLPSRLEVFQFTRTTSKTGHMLRMNTACVHEHCSFTIRIYLLGGPPGVCARRLSRYTPITACWQKMLITNYKHKAVDPYTAQTYNRNYIIINRWMAHVQSDRTFYMYGRGCDFNRRTQ